MIGCQFNLTANHFWEYYGMVEYICDLISDVARPGSTRAGALPSTLQDLPSPAWQESHDSITN